MKKIKLLLFGIILFMIIPVNANAETIEELTEEINKIPYKLENDVYYIDMPMLEPALIQDREKCITTVEDVRKQIEKELINDPEMPVPTEEQMEETATSSTEQCYNDLKTSMIDFMLKMNNKDIRSYDLQITFTDDTHVKIKKSDVYNYEQYIEREYVLRYKTDYNTNVKKDVDSFKDDLLKRYKISGFDIINSIYHYGGIDSNIYDNDLVLYRFSELKQFLQDHKDYKVIPLLYGAGAALQEAGNVGNLGIVKDGILYSISPATFTMDLTFYVDKNLSGSVYEKAKSRINEYFDGKVEISFDEENATIIEDDGMLNDSLNKNLGTTGVEYTGYLTLVTLGNKRCEMLLVEVDAKYLDKISEIKARDKETGVSFETKSYEVAIDTLIDVEDVSDTDYVVKFTKDNNVNLIKAYDINLKKATDGTLIKSIENGIEVYLPVENGQVGDTYNVYFVKEDSTIGETYEATVVEIDGKLYAKFTTTHFSTYAIGKAQEVNPKTNDNIFKVLILGMVSLLGIICYKKM